MKKIAGYIVAPLAVTLLVLMLAVPSFGQLVTKGADFVFDTVTRGLKVYVVTLLGGEHIDAAEENGYLRTTGGLARTFALMTDVITDATSSTPIVLPAGGKTFFSKVVGSAGAQSATITIWGDYKSTATEEFLICTMSLSGTSEDAKKCTGISEDYKYYHAKIASLLGTDATINVWAEVGLGGGSGGAGGGDASESEQQAQTALLGTIDADTGAISLGTGGTADAAATAGSTGSINAKLRFVTSILDTISTTLSSILTALQLIDDDQTGTSTNYLTSAGVTEDETQIKATAGRLMGIQITNTNAAVRYFRCANLTAANTTPGSSTVFYGIAVPGATTGSGLVVNFGPAGLAFSTALTCWLTTGVADTDVAEVAANEIKWNIQYK